MIVCSQTIRPNICIDSYRLFHRPVSPLFRQFRFPFVIPAEAGIQRTTALLAAGRGQALRGSDVGGPSPPESRPGQALALPQRGRG